MESVEKFTDPFVTAKGEKRASVALKSLNTLWFNTGTQCNLSCANCYIESSPKNDRLSLITLDDVKPYLDEIEDNQWPTKEIGFTGGEPFLNPQMVDILKETLSRGFKTIVLTNAYRLFNRYREQVVELVLQYPELLLVRVSLDHYSLEEHEKERGPGTFEPTLKAIHWIHENKIPLAIAGRGLKDESFESSVDGYKQLLNQWKIDLDFNDSEKFVVFPEMSPTKEVPEITTECWGILDKSPNDIMCSSSRMIVKRKGEDQAKVLACTLLAYDKEFELGETLSAAQKKVQLNHSYCAQFCVLGGASCS